MSKELKEIEVSHISLVKAGANGKAIIYKSAEEAPTWEREFSIKKRDDEKGIVYGIVYSPEEEDSQGDFAKSEEIEKAAYGFMKAKRIENVDKEHTFEKEDAYVCESWIVRKSDALFGDEPEGSWAVGIKLESEDLKKAVKKGEIKGLSMAGKASRVETKKSTNTPMDELVEAMKRVFTSVHLNISGSHYKRELEKSKTQGEELDKETLEKALAGALDAGLKPLSVKIETLQKTIDTQADELKKAELKLENHEEMLAKSKQFFAFEKTKTESDDSIMA